MKRALFIAAVLWPLAAGTAWPIDQIYTSTSDRPYFGEIVSMSAITINFKSHSKDAPGEIPVNEIKRITLENSPQGLLEAQKDILDGDYEKATEALKKENTEDKRPEVAQEIIFCRAFCMAQLALAGEGDVNVLEAGTQMSNFVKEYPNNYHYYKACEVVGDLCVVAGKFEFAQTFYGKLSQAPWPDYKIRAQVALGRAFLAQGDATAADKAFDEALNNDSPGELAETQRIAAHIGKARCMVLHNKTDLALNSLGEIMDKLDDKNPEICAMAYNALGTALRKANKPKEAILAFLHVHLMYDTQPDAHAEAVANLEKLFTETHNPGHARDMQSILQERYRNSRWAKSAK